MTRPQPRQAPHPPGSLDPRAGEASPVPPPDIDRRVPFLSFQVDEPGVPAPLGSILRRRLRLSRSLYRRLKHQDGIWVNGRPCRADALVRPGDRITLALAAPATAAPEPVPLAVVFEDEHLLVLDKPPGLVVHPSRGHRHGTILNGVVDHRIRRGEPPWAHPVHRLDRGTSGLMVVAKDPYVHERLASPSGELLRTYAALVIGHPAVSSGAADTPIEEPRPSASNARPGPAGQVPRVAGERGRPAYTRYRVAARLTLDGHPVSLVVVRMRTGRTHQIRVHMADEGHPLVGDALYGAGTEAASLSRPDAPGWPALHARTLRFVHPVTGKRLRFKSTVPLLPFAPREEAAPL